MLAWEWVWIETHSLEEIGSIQRSGHNRNEDVLSTHDRRWNILELKYLWPTVLSKYDGLHWFMPSSAEDGDRVQRDNPRWSTMVDLLK
jgi:hypothetical protein